MEERPCKPRRVPNGVLPQNRATRRTTGMAAGVRAATPPQPHGLHMDLFAWLAFGCYLLAFVIVALFAAAYLRRSDFMPYHGQAVGLPGLRLNPHAGAGDGPHPRGGAGWIALAGAGVMLAWLIFFGGHFALPQLLAFQLFCLVATVRRCWSPPACGDAPVRVPRYPPARPWCCCRSSASCCAVVPVSSLPSPRGSAMNPESIFYRVVNGDLPRSQAGTLLGWRFVDYDDARRRIQVEFEARPLLTNPMGNVQGIPVCDAR